MTIRPHANFSGIIDRAYATGDSVDAYPADDRAWAEALAAQLGHLFDGVIATGTSLWQHDGWQHVSLHFATGCGTPIDDDVATAIGRDELARYVEHAGVVSTHAEQAPTLSAQARERLHAQHAALGAVDAIELHVQPEPGVMLWLVVLTRAPVRLTARQRMRLVQVALHVQNALRLRRTPHAVQAFVSHAGVLSGDFTAPTVRRVDGKRPHDVSTLWHALVTGSYSIVPHVAQGVPCYGVLENAPAARPHRALSADEKRVVQHASRGLSNKSLGHVLGMSPSTISRLLESAALKLGLGSRAKLVRLASLLSGGETQGTIPTLTQAEADVLELVRAGLSNRDIGASRGRSERTVANQVASLLKKTGSANRRRLIAGSFHSAR